MSFQIQDSVPFVPPRGAIYLDWETRFFITLETLENLIQINQALPLFPSTACSTI